MFAMKSRRKGVRLRGTELARAFHEAPRGRRV
jgi:hypothetical protein